MADGVRLKGVRTRPENEWLQQAAPSKGGLSAFAS